MNGKHDDGGDDGGGGGGGGDGDGGGEVFAPRSSSVGSLREPRGGSGVI